MEHNIKHLAIIMDGNRTWASERGLPKFLGHTEGVQALKRTIKAVVEKKIPFLTAWALSTENLQRPKDELDHLFSLFEKLPNSLKEFTKNNVRITTIGDLSRIPQKVHDVLEKLKQETKENTGTVLNLAVAYGGRDELVRATKKIIEAGLKPKEITETTFEEFLDTADMPEVDLIIRTGGHQRLSGYLPWQSTYAELYYTSLRFPDFNEEELDKAIEWFNQQERKRGK
jgi:undecaprenyl diphosphate synthase